MMRMFVPFCLLLSLNVLTSAQNVWATSLHDRLEATLAVIPSFHLTEKALRFSKESDYDAFLDRAHTRWEEYVYNNFGINADQEPLPDFVLADHLLSEIDFPIYTQLLELIEHWPNADQIFEFEDPIHPGSTLVLSRNTLDDSHLWPDEIDHLGEQEHSEPPLENGT